MEKEIWTLIPSAIVGFENDRFWVSNSGKVYNSKTNNIMSLVPQEKGYYRVTLGGKCFRIHRLVAMLYVPKTHDLPYDQLEVNHNDHDMSNNAASNLSWMTHDENIAYRTQQGRKRKTRKKFTRDEWFYIYTHKGKKSSSVLAKELNCMPDSISKIWRGISGVNYLQEFQQAQLL
jgi:hypothetical protein